MLNWVSLQNSRSKQKKSDTVLSKVIPVYIPNIHNFIFSHSSSPPLPSPSPPLPFSLIILNFLLILLLSISSPSYSPLTIILHYPFHPFSPSSHSYTTPTPLPSYYNYPRIPLTFPSLLLKSPVSPLHPTFTILHLVLCPFLSSSNSSSSPPHPHLFLLPSTPHTPLPLPPLPPPPPLLHPCLFLFLPTLDLLTAIIKISCCEFQHSYSTFSISKSFP